MPIIEYDTYKQKLGAMGPKLETLAAALDLEGARREVEELEEKTGDPNFWNDVAASQKVLQRTKQLKNKLENHERLTAQWEDLTTLVEMAMEEDDGSLLAEVEEGYAKLESALEEANLATLLTGEYDASSAILTLHAGAGGTEAQDWCQMLYRMYTRWAERHSFTVKTLDYEDGDEAGLKSAAISIEGENAYGFLRSEHGVHRLVRISPFDANARRQTSFAAVEVMPEIDDDTSVEIRQEDIEMQVYRASGAGGQHVNKTSSAVRLIHKPTGTVVECQQERSQFQNRDKAMRILASRLYEAEQEKITGEYSRQRRSQVGSGMRNERIRTYNFPQGRVTDHRIGLTLYKIDQVMDGALDEIIDALAADHQAELLKEQST